jgi:hypothetical protein
MAPRQSEKTEDEEVLREDYLLFPEENNQTIRTTGVQGLQRREELQEGGMPRGDGGMDINGRSGITA